MNRCCTKNNYQTKIKYTNFKHINISIRVKPCKWCKHDIFFCGCDLPEYYKQCSKCKEILS